MLIVFWVLLGAAGGGMLSGSIADASANHPGDIGRVFGGLVFGGLIGAVAGGFAARALTQKFPDGSPQRRYLIGATFAIPLVFFFGAMWIESVRTADLLLKKGGAAKVVYQVLLPPGATQPKDTEVVAEFRTEKETRKQSFPGHDVEVERRGDRVVIYGSFDTLRTAEQRSIRLQVRGGPTYIYSLKQMPPRPPLGYAKDYYAWQAPDQIEEAGNPPRAPRPDETMQIRYKMDMI